MVNFQTEMMKNYYFRVLVCDSLGVTGSQRSIYPAALFLGASSRVRARARAPRLQKSAASSFASARARYPLLLLST